MTGKLIFTVEAAHARGREDSRNAVIRGAKEPFLFCPYREHPFKGAWLNGLQGYSVDRFA